MGGAERVEAARIPLVVNQSSALVQTANQPDKEEEATTGIRLPPPPVGPNVDLRDRGRKEVNEWFVKCCGMCYKQSQVFKPRSFLRRSFHRSLCSSQTSGTEL